MVPLVFNTMLRRWTTVRPAVPVWPHRPLPNSGGGGGLGRHSAFTNGKSATELQEILVVDSANHSTEVIIQLRYLFEASNTCCMRGLVGPGGGLRHSFHGGHHSPSLLLSSKQIMSHEGHGLVVVCLSRKGCASGDKCMPRWWWGGGIIFDIRIFELGMYSRAEGYLQVHSVVSCIRSMLCCDVRLGVELCCHAHGLVGDMHKA